MNRTVEDYDLMAKREMIKAKQEKATMSVPPTYLTNFPDPLTICIHCRRVQKFRSDYNEFRSQFERLKAEVGPVEVGPITRSDLLVYLENLSGQVRAPRHINLRNTPLGRCRFLLRHTSQIRSNQPFHVIHLKPFRIRISGHLGIPVLTTTKFHGRLTGRSRAKRAQFHSEHGERVG